MATSQSQRLRRMAQKASRRKAAVAEKRRAEEVMTCGLKARQIDEAARGHLQACVVTESLFEDGIGWVVLARTSPPGDVAASFFLVDAWCLGIKDAFFTIMPRERFEERMDESGRAQRFVDIDPPVARKLLHDAAAYAGSFGFAPSRDFARAEVIFGSILMAAETFTFGKNGKPFFVSGPNDSPTRIRRVLNTLTQRVGPDGFDYVVHIADFHDGEFSPLAEWQTPASRAHELRETR